MSGAAGTLRPGNPMSRVLMSVLVFQVVIFGLSIFVMWQLVPLPIGRAALYGGGGALLALAAAGTLRRPLGQWLGWLTQAVMLLLGLVTWGMAVMGLLFGGLWVITFVLGKRLERSGAVS